MSSTSTDTATGLSRGDVGVAPTARRQKSAVAALVVWLAASGVNLGCGGGTTAPSDPYAGAWSGVVDDAEQGRGSLQLTLSDDAHLSGRWSLLIAASSAAGSISPVPTMLGGPDRQFTMTCGEPPAGGVLLLTASLDGGALQGSYFAIGCANLTRGSIRLARR